MRIFPLVALLTLLASAAAAQTIDQMGLFRLPDNTPRSTRSAAIGNALDPLGDDFTLNPATAAAISKPMLRVQGERQSIAIPLAVFDTSGRIIAPRTWLERDQVTLVSAAMPVHGFVAGVYYASDPRVTAPPQRSPTAAPVSPALVFDRAMKRSGISAAWERGGLAAGVGLELQSLDESYEIVRLVGTIDHPIDPFAERVFRRIDDHALVPNAGLRYVVSPRLAVAASYRGGATFDRVTSVCGLGLAPGDWRSCTSAVTPLAHSDLRTPATYRASVGLNVTDRLRAVGEAVHRGYSSLAQDDYTVVGTSYRFPYHDVTELHAGLEYRLAALPVSLRAGWWSDPARMDGNGVPLPVTQSFTHYTAGAGLDLRNGTRLDIAYDTSDDPMSRALVAGVTFR